MLYSLNQEEETGESMSRKIDVLGIRLDDYTAKDAMKAITEFLKEEMASLVEVVTAESVMRMTQNEPQRSESDTMDMIIPGDRAILEAAEVKDEKLLRQAQRGDFVKLLFQYLHKNEANIFLLADTMDEAQSLENWIQKKYKNIRIAGRMAVPEGTLSDDMIINLINGAGAECIIASVTSGRQEEFIFRCRNVLNVKLWIGISQAERFFEEKGSLAERIFVFLNQKILKRKAIREKKRRNA